MIHIASIPNWVDRMFNPPPLVNLSMRQKASRVILITVSLVALCIIAAMVLAVVIFLVQKAPGLYASLFADDFSLAVKMSGIILLSAVVNSICVWVLLQMRRLDRELMNGQKDLSELLRKSGR